jgi:hypothetical protein
VGMVWRLNDGVAAGCIGGRRGNGMERRKNRRTPEIS